LTPLLPSCNAPQWALIVSGREAAIVPWAWAFVTPVIRNRDFGSAALPLTGLKKGAAEANLRRSGF
jgi:hypothetical protein